MLTDFLKHHPIVPFVRQSDFAVRKPWSSPSADCLIIYWYTFKRALAVSISILRNIHLTRASFALYSLAACCLWKDWQIPLRPISILTSLLTPNASTVFLPALDKLIYQLISISCSQPSKTCTGWKCLCMLNHQTFKTKRNTVTGHWTSRKAGSAHSTQNPASSNGDHPLFIRDLLSRTLYCVTFFRLDYFLLLASFEWPYLLRGHGRTS